MSQSITFVGTHEGKVVKTAVVDLQAFLLAGANDHVFVYVQSDDGTEGDPSDIPKGAIEWTGVEA